MNLFVQLVIIPLDYMFQMTIWYHSHAPMTISSRCGIALRDNGNMFLQGLGKALNWISKGHTDAAIEADIERNTDALNILKGQ